MPATDYPVHCPGSIKYGSTRLLPPAHFLNPFTNIQSHLAFKIVIPSRLSPRGGTFKLVFYCPDSYLREPEDGEYRYPVVVNFHGGGFTLGTGTDDARWAASVVTNTDAIMVSVEYRLAPEYPFSVGVEDGTDTLMYLASHAEELRLDPHRFALSGFSAGGNFAFTVPLMLYDLQHNAGKRSMLKNQADLYRPSSSHYKSSSMLSLPRTQAIRSHSSSAHPLRAQHSTTSILKLANLEPTALEINQKIPDLTIKCIVSFYPPTDFRISREEKRHTNPQPEKNLPPMLTNLFDDSYIHPKICVDMTDPYLSPAAASDDFLRAAYPDDIVMYTCEYDMLNAEGVAFGDRLANTVGKKLHGGLIRGVPHAFDKKPNPISFPKAADRCYAEACAELKQCFGGRASVDERRILDQSLNVNRFEAEESGDIVIGENRPEADAAERERTDQLMEILAQGGGKSEDDNLKFGRRTNSISAFRSRWKINQTSTIEERGRQAPRLGISDPGPSQNLIG
jgi:acetyl esterase/lipase